MRVLFSLALNGSYDSQQVRVRDFHRGEAGASSEEAFDASGFEDRRGTG